MEKRWIGGAPIQTGGITGDAVVEFNQELEVTKGDRILFAVNPEGNDAWDGGRLAITIDEVN